MPNRMPTGCLLVGTTRCVRATVARHRKPGNPARRASMVLESRRQQDHHAPAEDTVPPGRKREPTRWRRATTRRRCFKTVLYETKGPVYFLDPDGIEMELFGNTYATEEEGLAYMKSTRGGAAPLDIAAPEPPRPEIPKADFTRVG